MAIQSFRHKGLRRLFEHELPQTLSISCEICSSPSIQQSTVDEIGLFPGWRLHPLKGDLAGFWSLTVM
jgi:proteic killer suppression protein